MWETQVRYLDWEDPLEKEMVTHSSTSAWKNPMDGGDWQATVHGLVKSRTRLSGFTSCLVDESCPTLSRPLRKRICNWKRGI